MKKQTLMAFTLAATTLIGTSAFAADGTINFTGEIKNATCTVSTSAGGSETLPPVSKAYLEALADGPAKDFDITLGGTNCSGSEVEVSFEQDPANIDLATGFLVNKDPDTGASVAVELLETDGTPIPLNDPAYKTTPVSLSTGSATIPLKVRYKARGTTVEAGPVTASVGVWVHVN